jgi:hypothetical protein
MKKIALKFYRRLLKASAEFRSGHILAGKVEADRLKQVKRQNRQALALINDWLPAGLIEKSIFRYGVNPEVEPLLNLQMDDECTHTDLLTYFGQACLEPRKYLELGVSVGKTFWQILNTCSPCECWGFDIEEINPVLKQHFSEQSKEEWPTPLDSIKKTPSSISRFIYPPNGNQIVYVCADIFDERAWKCLGGKDFNLVLSDALHTPQALEFEWSQMTRMKIFNPAEAVVMWDDLDGEMRDWFKAKEPAIANYLNVAPANVGTLYLNGWLGKREFPHRLGLALTWPLVRDNHSA